MLNLKELLEEHRKTHKCAADCQYAGALNDVQKEFVEHIAFLKNELNVHKQICMCSGCVAKRRKMEILNEVITGESSDIVKF